MTKEELKTQILLLLGSSGNKESIFLDEVHQAVGEKFENITSLLTFVNDANEEQLAKIAAKLPGTNVEAAPASAAATPAPAVKPVDHQQKAIDELAAAVQSHKDGENFAPTLEGILQRHQGMSLDKIPTGWTSGATVLMKTATEGDKEMVQALVTKGANAKIADKGGWTALHYAASNGKKEVVEALLALPEDKRPDINARSVGGLTALDLAKTNNNTEIVSMLEAAASGKAAAPAAAAPAVEKASPTFSVNQGVLTIDYNGTLTDKQIAAQDSAWKQVGTKITGISEAKHLKAIEEYNAKHKDSIFAALSPAPATQKTTKSLGTPTETVPTADKNTAPVAESTVQQSRSFTPKSATKGGGTLDTAKETPPAPTETETKTEAAKKAAVTIGVGAQGENTTTLRDVMAKVGVKIEAKDAPLSVAEFQQVARLDMARQAWARDNHQKLPSLFVRGDDGHDRINPIELNAVAKERESLSQQPLSHVGTRLSDKQIKSLGTQGLNELVKNDKDQNGVITPEEAKAAKVNLAGLENKAFDMPSVGYAHQVLGVKSEAAREIDAATARVKARGEQAEAKYEAIHDAMAHGKMVLNKVDTGFLGGNKKISTEEVVKYARTHDNPLAEAFRNRNYSLGEVAIGNLGISERKANELYEKSHGDVGKLTELVDKEIARQIQAGLAQSGASISASSAGNGAHNKSSQKYP